MWFNRDHWLRNYLSPLLNSINIRTLARKASARNRQFHYFITVYCVLQLLWGIRQENRQQMKWRQCDFAASNPPWFCLAFIDVGMMILSLLYLVSVYFSPTVSAVECIQGEGDYTGIRYLIGLCLPNPFQIFRELYGGALRCMEMANTFGDFN